jgi:hypothetical protein
MAAIEDDSESNTWREWGDENPVQSVTRDLPLGIKVYRADGVVESTFAVAIWILDLAPCLSIRKQTLSCGEGQHTPWPL